MGGKSGPSPPPAPDPNALIAAQAQANRVNENNLFGSSQYSQDPSGQWSRNTTLNPMLQNQLQGQMFMGQQSQNMANNLLPGAYQGLRDSPFKGLPDWTSQIQVGNAASYLPRGMQQSGQRLGIQGSVDPGGPSAKFLGRPDPVNANSFDINSYYGKVLAPMQQTINKDFGRSGQHLDAQLAAQGLPLGSDAYREAQSIQNEAKNDALTRASSAAYGQALGASQNAFGQALGANQNQFGQNLASGQFYNQGLGQDFGRNLAAGAFGNQAQAQQYGQGLQGLGYGLQARGQDIGLGGMNAGLQNQWRQQALGENMQGRYLPFQDIQQLQGLSQPNVPNFSGIPGLDVTGPYGLAYQGQLNAYNTQAGNNQANMGGLFGLLGGIGQSMPWGQWFGGG